jgi:hypothetical protein
MNRGQSASGARLARGKQNEIPDFVEAELAWIRQRAMSINKPRRGR